MLTYPQMDPVAFSLGPIKVHWYGIMYLLGFALAYGLANFRRRTAPFQNWTKEMVSDLIFYAALGTIIGGRLGYMLFYEPHAWLAEPWVIFKVWQGGMSFHGGLIGVLIALCFFAKKIKIPLLRVMDFIAPLVPLGLALGRLGNFINGELWGRVTTVPWAMVFPEGGPYPRHPSQLYEIGLEGILLFIIVWYYALKPRPLGRVSALFLIGYAICRIIVEFFREPDPQLGYLAFGWLTMGQILSLPMLIFGFYLWGQRRWKTI